MAVGMDFKSSPNYKLLYLLPALPTKLLDNFHIIVRDRHIRMTSIDHQAIRPGLIRSINT